MKNITKFIVAVAIFAMITGVAVYASSDDPLISKSYFDTKITDLKNELNQKIDQINTSSTPGGAAVFKAVKINAGKTVVFGAGTEIIHRSGKATLLDSTGNGVPDVTSGKNVSNRQPLEKNHLMVFPRNDGRGIVTKTNVWIMLKGSATILE